MKVEEILKRGRHREQLWKDTGGTMMKEKNRDQMRNER